MTEEINPYLPPASGPERLTTRRWHLEGPHLLVRNGTVLPRVDLVSGVSEETMKTMVHHVRPPGVIQNMGGFLVVGGFFALKYQFDITPPGGLIPYMLCGGFVIDLIFRKLGWAKPVMIFTSFCDPSRHRTAKMRKVGFVLLILVAFGILLLGIFNIPAMLNWGNWIFFVMVAPVIAVSGLVIWSTLFEARTRPQALEDGWIQVKSIHPGALRFLQAERDRLDLLHAENPSRTPLTIRVFLQRFPIRFLLHGQFHNLFYVLRVLWLKWMRSPHFAREVLHHSEAVEIDRDQLHPRLSEVCVSWLNRHPDWHFVRAESLGSLHGDATTQTVILTRHDRVTTLRLTRTWVVTRPDRAEIGCCFITRLRGGNHRYTLNQPLLDLPGSEDIFHQFRGDPAAIYQKHLELIHHDAVHPPASDEELLADLRTEKEMAERRLIEAGLQSAPAPATEPI